MTQKCGLYFFFSSQKQFDVSKSIVLVSEMKNELRAYFDWINLDRFI